MNRLCSLLLATVALGATALPAHAVVRDETICGWIDMEGQYYAALTDAFDTYVLSNDVGAVEGFDTITNIQTGAGWMDPEAREARYCGCVGATFNGAELIKIYSFRQKRVDVCLNDPKLPRF